MTSNQIAYWRDQETKRSNLANENIKAFEAKTKAKEANTKRGALLEDMRHNRYEEDLAHQRFKDQQKQWVGDALIKWATGAGKAVSDIFS